MAQMPQHFNSATVPVALLTSRARNQEAGTGLAVPLIRAFGVVRKCLDLVGVLTVDHRAALPRVQAASV